MNPNYIINKILQNSIKQEEQFNNKKEINEDDISDTSIDEETIPDEDFRFKKRHKIISCPNVDNSQEGVNINLKINHKRYSNQKEKEFFFEKIKRKKKTELCKNYELYHACFYKNDCCFAHGIEELRDNYVLPSYKTKRCKSFIDNKICNFGKRCSYKHTIK